MKFSLIQIKKHFALIPLLAIVLLGAQASPVQAQSTASTNVLSCQKDFSQITGIINYVTCTISSSIIPLLFAVAMLVFFYGVVKYVIAGDGSDDREEGRWFMIYGVVGLFVMISVWGLVALISNTFEIGTSFPPEFH
jgi:hypothetical protein